MKNREQGKSELADNRTMRLFFAIWPKMPLRQELHRMAVQQQQAYGGRVMRAESIHLTLLFLGETLREHLQELQRAAAAVHMRRFDLVLEQIAGWRHNGIVYAAPTRHSDRLSELAAELRACIDEAGFIFDDRAFTPHVTLLRKVSRVPELQAVKPMHWPVNEFVLVQSILDESGIRYEILGCWALE